MKKKRLEVNSTGSSLLLYFGKNVYLSLVMLKLMRQLNISTRGYEPPISVYLEELNVVHGS